LGIEAPGDVAIWRGELEQDERLPSPTAAMAAVAKLPLVQSA
jgi:sRNA-binding carbon storage regulator CsrA